MAPSDEPKSSGVSFGSLSGKAEKVHEDRWNSNPPQVTSYLTYRRSEPSLLQTTGFKSHNCGLGWRFLLVESFRYHTTSSSPHIQELVGQVEITFQPHMCSSMPLRNIKVDVKVSYPTDDTKLTHQRKFPSIPVRSNYAIGTYVEPLRYTGQTHVEITITFNPSDGLSFPTTPSINTTKALRHSIDGPSFVDTKFYLFSAKIEGRPALPKAAFAKSMLLTDTGSTYLRDLLSPETGFANGTPCDLREDVPQEIAKLDADAFEYDSDSDLEGDDGTSKKGKEKAPATSSVSEIEIGSTSEGQVGKTSANPEDGRAFAINGTAYKTWKAFIFYAYTNDIQFNLLKSQRELAPLAKTGNSVDSNLISCSPKSMYRFADYADLPHLKALAKEGIRKSLSKYNIVTELFSSFTSKYQEIMELEVDFLADNFTSDVARDLDEMLELIVLGTKPYCFRVLALAMRRLRGDSTESAWKALDRKTPSRGPRSTSPLQGLESSPGTSLPPSPKGGPGEATEAKIPTERKPERGAGFAPGSGTGSGLGSWGSVFGGSKSDSTPFGLWGAGTSLPKGSPMEIAEAKTPTEREPEKSVAFGQGTSSGPGASESVFGSSKSDSTLFGLWGAEASSPVAPGTKKKKQKGRK